MKKTIEEIDRIYQDVYGHPIFTDGVSQKNKKHIDNLLGALCSVPLQEGHIRNDVAKYYGTVAIAYMHRSFAFHPTIPLMCSQKIIDMVIGRYNKGYPILEAELFMTKLPLKSLRKKKQGLFFGYSFDEIDGFSHESSDFVLASHVMLRRGSGNVKPSLSVLKTLDRAIFLSLGNNYIQEHRKVSYKNYNGFGLETDYITIARMLVLKDQLAAQCKDIKATDIYSDLGYNLITTMGTSKVNLCELLIWKNGIRQKDLPLIRYIQEKTKVYNIDLSELVEECLQTINTSIPKHELKYVYQAVTEAELNKTVEQILSAAQKGELQ
jgi:hypothetical protein